MDTVCRVRVGLILIVLLLIRLRVFKDHRAAVNPWLLGLGLALAAWARVYLGGN